MFTRLFSLCSIISFLHWPKGCCGTDQSALKWFISGSRYLLFILIDELLWTVTISLTRLRHSLVLYQHLCSRGVRQSCCVTGLQLLTFLFVVTQSESDLTLHSSSLNICDYRHFVESRHQRSVTASLQCPALAEKLVCFSLSTFPVATQRERHDIIYVLLIANYLLSTSVIKMCATMPPNTS